MVYRRTDDQGVGQGGMDAAREGERERRVGATLFRCDLHQQATIKWLSPRQWPPADARTSSQYRPFSCGEICDSTRNSELPVWQLHLANFAGIFGIFVSAGRLRHFWSRKCRPVSGICGRHASAHRMVSHFFGGHNCSVDDV